MDVAICAGKFKGKKLRIPDSIIDFRPTKLMVREAICSSIMMDIVDSNTLELCGGSGVFSLELLSRGANHSTIVELDPKRSKLITKFSEELSLVSDTKIINDDVKSALDKIDDTFHIIFFDPPYYTDDLADCIPQALGLLSPGSILIFEHATNDSYIDKICIPDGYKVKIKKYGQTTIRYYRNKE